MTVQKEKMHACNMNLQTKKLIWVSFLILDLFLHKTSRIEILEHLAQRGYTVYLVAMRSRRKYEPRNSKTHIISIPLRYVPIISPVLFVGILLFILPYYIISVNPDFIVTGPTTSILSFVWTPILSRVRRFKMVLDIRTTPVETFGVSGFLKTLFFNFSVFWAKNFFAGITIVTTLMKREICDRFHIDPRFVGVWTSGVSPTLFSLEKCKEEAVALRRKEGLTGRFIVFHHGDLGVKRGIDMCVESIAVLRNECPDLVLFLLGSGFALEEIESIIQKRGIQDRVIIHDPVDYEDVPKYVAMCDVGIIPLPDLRDWRHQCPLKLLEYLSMKRVVILTDIPAHREVIGKSKCGIYVSSASVMEIVSAIKYVYNNRERVKQLGSRGRAIINKRYTWNKVAESFDNYLSTLKSSSNNR